MNTGVIARYDTGRAPVLLSDRPDVAVVGTRGDQFVSTLWFVSTLYSDTVGRVERAGPRALTAKAPEGASARPVASGVSR